MAYTEGEPDQVLREILDSATSGNTESMVWLGCHAETPEKRLAWFRMAAERGDVDGMTGVAYALLTGDGIELDVDEGFRWAKEAARHRSMSGHVLLCACYLAGHGTKPDAVRAVAHRMAAERLDQRDTLRPGWHEFFTDVSSDDWREAGRLCDELLGPAQGKAN